MDITTLSIEQLKALAYDIKVQIELNNQNLAKVEGEINRKMGEIAEKQAMEEQKKHDEEIRKHDAEAAAHDAEARKMDEAVSGADEAKAPEYEKVDENAKPGKTDKKKA